jgi:hypothetical protein
LVEAAAESNEWESAKFLRRTVFDRGIANLGIFVIPDFPAGPWRLPALFSLASWDTSII